MEEKQKQYVGFLHWLVQLGVNIFSDYMYLHEFEWLQAG